EIESGSEKRRKKSASYSPSWCQTYTLFLDLRNVPGGKLPATIALDQRVRELHDSIECFAVRCSFHARFPENNRYAIIVKSRYHVVVFEHVVTHFSAAQLVDLIRTGAHFAIRERQRKIGGEHALHRGHICIKKCLARVALELEHFLLSRRLGR